MSAVLKRLQLLCVLVLLAPGLLAYKHFQQRIPNGDRIPHPCKPNFMWQGVGHLKKDGGGARNRFGEDFDSNGQKWDQCLCEADSDGDGMTNGEELGDPDCEWVPGATPNITDLNKLSHPGVCDPHDSPQCESVNDWEFCGAAAGFKCDAFDAKDVKNFTVQMSPVQVPAQVTTYMCDLVDIPTGGDWHVIGYIAEIDNLNVMHHITVGLCTDKEVAAMDGKWDDPAKCGMGVDVCSGLLFSWTVAMDGNCLPDSFGQPIGGNTGYVKALIVYHYNNPEKRADYTDSSALRYFYEPRKRPNDRTALRLSPMELSIPPKQLYFEQVGVCSAECSDKHLGKVRYITDVTPHMHYMGRGFILEHYRGDQKLPDIVNMDDYNYDSPKTFWFEPPIEYSPGDKLVLRCFFNSMPHEKWTFFGENTYDEMCIAFIGLYPPPRFNCFGIDEERSVCNSGPQNLTVMMGNMTGCHVGQYMKEEAQQAYATVASVCDPDGVTCKSGCKEALEEVHQNSCMKGMYLPITKHLLTQNKIFGFPLLHLLQSCEPFEVHKVSDAAGPAADAGASLCAVRDDAGSGVEPVARGSLLTVLLLLLTLAIFLGTAHG